MSNLDLFRKNFILSIKPEYAFRIVEGSKTVELRRRFPYGTATGALMFVYASAPIQALIGYATIMDVEKRDVKDIWNVYNEVAYIKQDDFNGYFLGRDVGFVIRLGQPVSLSAPIGLSVLKSKLGFTPPQSFAYADDRLQQLVREG